jgi:hypothetical protein
LSDASVEDGESKYFTTGVKDVGIRQAQQERRHSEARKAQRPRVGYAGAKSWRA